MAIAQNPITGQMRKSYANVNTYVLNGQNVVSSKAFNRKDKNSEAQKAQRASFKIIGDVWGWVGSFAEAGLLNLPQTQSPYNAFMAINLPAAIDNSGEAPVLDYPKLQISKGTLTAVEVINTSVSDSVLTIVYDSQKDFPRVETTDVITVLVKTTRGAVYFKRKARGAEHEDSLEVQMRNVMLEDVECVYLYTTSADGKKVSNSVYVNVNP